MPVIERATGRRRRNRTRTVVLATLGVVGLAGIAGVVAYLFWPRDEEPAFLMDAPDAPHMTPTGMPSTDSPAPGAPTPPSDAHFGDAPAAPPLDARSDRELARAAGHRDERPIEGGPSLPTAARTPFASARVQLPDNARRTWLPR